MSARSAVTLSGDDLGGSRPPRPALPQPLLRQGDRAGVLVDPDRPEPETAGDRQRGPAAAAAIQNHRSPWHQMGQVILAILLVLLVLVTGLLAPGALQKVEDGR